MGCSDKVMVLDDSAEVKHSMSWCHNLIRRFGLYLSKLLCVAGAARSMMVTEILTLLSAGRGLDPQQSPGVAAAYQILLLLGCLKNLELYQCRVDILEGHTRPEDQTLGSDIVH